MQLRATSTTFSAVMTVASIPSVCIDARVRSWSLAEDLTPIEIADGQKLLGRNRRMTPADYAGDRFIGTLLQDLPTTMGRRSSTDRDRVSPQSGSRSGPR